jgi:hypothetical protein
MELDLRRALLLIMLCVPSLLTSEVVRVRHREGVSHGFLTLRGPEGELLASGELIQGVKGNEITTELVFHFKDGSLHDETTVISQRGSFRLIKDHLVQKGPSFPKPVDATIDARAGQVLITTEEDGKEKSATEQVKIPDDAANGMLMILLKNIDPSTPAAVSFVTPSLKPRVVKQEVTSSRQLPFEVGNRTLEGTEFVVKTKIGGLAGAVAPILGKQPPDIRFVLSRGKFPTFIRFEGFLYEGGPIWTIDLAAPHWPKSSGGSQ